MVVREIKVLKWRERASLMTIQTFFDQIYYKLKSSMKENEKKPNKELMFFFSLSKTPYFSITFILIRK